VRRAGCGALAALMLAGCASRPAEREARGGAAAVTAPAVATGIAPPAGVATAPAATMGEAVARALTHLARHAGRVVALRDTPYLHQHPLDCLGHTATTCARPRKRALGPDPSAWAAQRVPGVELLDLSDAFCSDDTCPYVIGNMVVYRDKGHLTATYSRSVAKALEVRLGNAFALP